MNIQLEHLNALISAVDKCPGLMASDRWAVFGLTIAWAEKSGFFRGEAVPQVRVNMGGDFPEFTPKFQTKISRTVRAAAAEADKEVASGFVSVGDALQSAGIAPVAVQPEPVAAPEKPAAKIASAAPRKPAAPKAPKVAAAPGLKLGPLDDQERAIILEMTAAGKSSAEVGKALNRRPQVIGLYLSNTGTKIAPAPQAAPKPYDPPKVAKPTVAYVAPVAADAVAEDVAEVVPEVRPGWWAPLEAQLNALGYKAPWTAQMDLELARGLLLGRPKEILADELGVEIGPLKQRFISLTPDGVTIEGQERLLKVLEHRAKGA